jgi:hypothetical protein
MTQMNLGLALQTLGERESGTGRLEEAVLGRALFRLGERESGAERLMEAIAAYREALQEYTRDRALLD